MASLSNSGSGGLAPPPRSNPFLRSSSEAPPFPCITPSTETCVVVVSFMVAILPFGGVLVSPGSVGEQGVHLADRLLQALGGASVQPLLHLFAGFEGRTQLHPGAALVLGELH